MKNLLIITFTCLMICGFLFASENEKKSEVSDPEAAEVMKVENEIMQAMLSNDSAAISNFLSDGWMIVQAHGGIVSKKRFPEVVKSGSLAYEKMAMEDPIVRVFGGAAIVTGRVTTTGKFMGETFTAQERSTDVFAKRDNRWTSVFSQLTSLATTQAEKSESAAPPGYTTNGKGNVDDFDYFAGGWTTHQRRLKARGVASKEWEEFPATLCMSLYLGGITTVDELYFPTKGWAGLTLRTFDLKNKQWSIYWVSSASGKMEAPVVGGFNEDHGEFYGEDLDNGRSVKVRYTWNKIDRDHARWEQAFSYDNRTWETNWTADFTRANTAATCENGRPKR